MTVQPPITLPPYTPTRWTLTLPDYPVITNSWRSWTFPEITGSLPSGAQWQLVYENMSDVETLALLLPWRATGGGQWPLTLLPAAVADGCDNESFRKRLTGTSWGMERKPRKESVKNGRFNVTIDLIHELTFTSIYGPSGSTFEPLEVPLRLNLFGVMSIAGLPVTTLREEARRDAGLVLDLDLSDGLDVAGVI